MKIITFIKTNMMLAAAILTAGATMSFTMAEKKAVVDVEYHFIGDDMDPGSFRNPANWSTTNNSVACISEEPILPCKITLPENVSLGSVLGSKNNAEVLAISEGYKPAP